MFSSIFPTICYVLGFVAIFLYMLRKKCDPVALYCVFVWIISSVYALVFQSMMSQWMYFDISFLPYIFLIICFTLTITPVCKGAHFVRNEYLINNIKIYKMIMFFFIIVSIIPFYENLKYVLFSYGAANTNSLADMYDDKMSGGTLNYHWLSYIGRIGNSLDGIFFQFIMFFPFVFFTQKKIKNTFLALSFIPAINHLLFQFCVSGRGTVAQFMLVSIFLLLLFRKSIPPQRLKFIKFFLITLFASFIAALSILTASRKDAHHKDVEDSVVVGYYLAKSHLDFNQSLWHIRKHTEGDNAFMYIKSLAGFDVPMNKNDFWNYNKTGILPYLFYTYIGDWYMDFGALVTLMLFIFVCVFCSFYFGKKNRFIPMSKLFMYYVLCQIVIMGWSINYFKTANGFRNLMISFFLIVFVENFSKQARQMNYDKS